MNDLMKKETSPAGKPPLVTVIAEQTAAEAAVAGVTALAASAAPIVAPVAVLAAIGIGTFKATLFGLETLEKAFTRK